LLFVALICYSVVETKRMEDDMNLQFNELLCPALCGRPMNLESILVGIATALVFYLVWRDIQSK